MKVEGWRVPLSEINASPFMDVMQVLLITFMVAAPLLEQGIQVTLPKAATGKQIQSGSGLVITLTREHLIYLNNEVVTLKELRKKLSGLQSSQPIMIRADNSAYVSRLVQLWDLCRDVGLREIHIATITE